MKYPNFLPTVFLGSILYLGLQAQCQGIILCGHCSGFGAAMQLEGFKPSLKNLRLARESHLESQVHP